MSEETSPQEEKTTLDRAIEFKEKVVAAAKEAGDPIPDNYHDDLVIVSEAYLTLMDGEDDQDLIDEYFKTMKSMISDWSWKGYETANVSFWQEALNTVVALAKPAAKELLKTATKAALELAKTKLANRLA